MDMSMSGPSPALPSSTGVPSGLPYAPLNPYNGTVPTGGDSKTEDLNTFFDVSDLSIP